MTRDSNYRNGSLAEVCYFCPENRNLEEHHIVPQRFGGLDTDSNLITVCKRCHGKLKRLYDKRFYEALGIADEQGERLFHRSCITGGCNQKATRKMNNRNGITVFKCDEHAWKVAKKTAEMSFQEYQDEEARHERIVEELRNRTYEASDEATTYE